MTTVNGPPLTSDDLEEVLLELNRFEKSPSQNIPNILYKSSVSLSSDCREDYRPILTSDSRVCKSGPARPISGQKHVTLHLLTSLLSLSHSLSLNQWEMGCFMVRLLTLLFYQCFTWKHIVTPFCSLTFINMANQQFILDWNLEYKWEIEIYNLRNGT